MPNHIQNRLKVFGSIEEIELVMNAISGDPFEGGEKRTIDFNKIIPMPQVIKEVGEIHHGVVTAVEKAVGIPLSDNPLLAAMQEMSRAKSDVRPEDQAEYDRAMKAYKDTGYIYWHDWSVKNWGTKWNAYNCDDEKDTDDTIFFHTAWSTPMPVIESLAKMFPSIKMSWDWADEDTGSNTGRVKLEGGQIWVHQPKNQSIEAYELCFELGYCDRDNYELVDGKYQYKEE